MITDSTITRFVQTNIPEKYYNVKDLFIAFLKAMIGVDSDIQDYLNNIVNYYNPFSSLFNPAWLLFDKLLKNEDLTRVLDIIPYAIDHFGYQFFFNFYAIYYSDQFDLLYADASGSTFSSLSPVIYTDMLRGTDEGYFTDNLGSIPVLFVKYYYEIDRAALLLGYRDEVIRMTTIFRPARYFVYFLPVFQINLRTVNDFTELNVLIDNPPEDLTTDVGLTTDSGLTTDASLEEVYGSYINIYLSPTQVDPYIVQPVISSEGIKWSLKVTEDVTYVRLEGASVWLEMEINADNYIEGVTLDGKSLLELFYRF